jgi:hypothetical protein
MADNSQSTIITSSLFKSGSNNLLQQKSKYLSTMITQKVIGKLYFSAIFNLVFGVVSIALYIGILFNDRIGYLH